jgi:hypothetical protein
MMKHRHPKIAKDGSTRPFRERAFVRLKGGSIMGEARNRRRRARKMQVGTVIRTETITDTHTGLLYWFEVPEGFSFEKEQRPPPNVELHGPFKTDAEVKEDQRLALLGPPRLGQAA